MTEMSPEQSSNESLPPEPLNHEHMMSPEQVQAMIDSAIARANAEHAAEMSKLKTDLADAQARAASLITSVVPEHAGGSSTEIAPTWSMAEQEKSWADKELALATMGVVTPATV